MEELYRDFTVCENCGKRCYLGNKYCEDCANELWEVECAFCAEKDKQIADLEAKLDEKDKERHEEWKTGKEWKWEWQKANRQLEQANQDKISFTVEQLEKALVLIQNAVNLESPEYDLVGLYDAIVDQIKQLKERSRDG